MFKLALISLCTRSLCFSSQCTFIYKIYNLIDYSWGKIWGYMDYTWKGVLDPLTLLSSSLSWLHELGSTRLLSYSKTFYSINSSHSHVSTIWLLPRLPLFLHLSHLTIHLPFALCSYVMFPFMLIHVLSHIVMHALCSNTNVWCIRSLSALSLWLFL